MGANYSSFRNLCANDYLLNYVGHTCIPDNEPFWRDFLAFTQFPPAEYAMLEKFEELGPSILRDLRKHNMKTHNLSSLMKFIISHGTQLVGSYSVSNPDTKLLLLVQNAFLVFRLSAKYLLEHTTEHNFMCHLTDGSSEIFSSSPLLEAFFQVIFNLLLNIPVNDVSYALHCEAVMSVLTLLARQMHREISSPLPLIYAYLMWGKCASSAPGVVQRLLQNFADNRPPPSGILGIPNKPNFVWRTASTLAGGLLTVVTLGYASRWYSNPSRATSTTDSADTNLTPEQTFDSLVCSDMPTPSHGPKDCNLLANLSSLLLLVLSTQAGSIAKCNTMLEQLGLNPQTPTLNPYRISLFSMRNSSEPNDIPEPTSAEKTSGVSNLNGQNSVATERESTAKLQGITSTSPPITANYPIDFLALLDTAAQTLHQDSSTLLLYLLIYRNVHFQTFLMENHNYDKLLLPLLNVLYRSPADSSHLVYMALIIILIWTENEKFSEGIHNTVIKWVKWSANQNLSSMSRGSLVILVLLRTVRYHLNQLKDKYLHVNILAALANLSSRVRNLHPYVSESFLRLLQLMVRRYNRTVEELRQTTKDKSTPAAENPALSNEDSIVHELSLLEEVIRMLLEILNSTLSHTLVANPNLVYSLLYGRDCLNPLRSHPSFQNVIQNIDTILTFFSTKITQDLGETPTSPSDLLAVINKYAPTIYRSCNLRKFPELKFKYVEEESPDEFFIPYVWSIVIKQSGIAFQTGSLPLFSPSVVQPDSVPPADDAPQDQLVNGPAADPTNAAPPT